MKKVLSLVLAAAMALGVTATAFALDANGAYNSVTDTNVSNLLKDDNGAPITPAVKKIYVSGLNYVDGTSIVAGDKHEFTYTVVTFGAAAIKESDYDVVVSVKGPADIVVGPRKVKGTWGMIKDGSATGDNDSIWGYAFDVTFTLQGTNDGSTSYKDLVITYGAKTDGLHGSKKYASKTDVKDKNVEAGYGALNEENLYNDAVQGVDDMNEYEDKNFELDLNNNPVIPASVVKFLQKNLSSKQSVIFTNTNGADSGSGDLYLDSATTLELNAAAIKALPTSNVNVKVNKKGVDEISDILDEAGIDYTWFNYASPRADITGKHSLDSTYDAPYVYLINEDGSITPVDTMDYDYGDVAFEGPMGQYIVTDGAIPEDLFADDTTDEPIEDDDLIDEPTEDDDNLVDEDGNPIENNPGTGSSNAISLAVAMAVVSLAAAGLVATKKASK